MSHCDTDICSDKDPDLSRENEPLRWEHRIFREDRKILKGDAVFLRTKSNGIQVHRRAPEMYSPHACPLKILKKQEKPPQVDYGLTITIGSIWSSAASHPP